MTLATTIASAAPPGEGIYFLITILIPGALAWLAGVVTAIAALVISRSLIRGPIWALIAFGSLALHLVPLLLMVWFFGADMTGPQWLIIMVSCYGAPAACPLLAIIVLSLKDTPNQDFPQSGGPDKL